MRPGFAKAVWMRRRAETPRTGSLRILPLLVCALAVIAGMLLMADRARSAADRARQAQVLMERVRNGTQRVEQAVGAPPRTAALEKTAACPGSTLAHPPIPPRRHA